MYKLLINPMTNQPSMTFMRLSDGAYIPFDEANTDYQEFKTDIANGVELQDADGNVMSAQAVTEFLQGLK